jgi:hypothetical protein
MEGPMMRNLFLVILLAVLVACGAPAPEGEEPVTDDAPMETATGDDHEGEEEEEALEVPPEGALPLPEVIAKLEALGYTGIVETEFEDGVWEVEYVVDGEERELHVDPMTGEILPEDPEGDETEDQDP